VHDRWAVCDAFDVLRAGAGPTINLPAASRLTDALSDLCAAAPAIDVDDVADDDWVQGDPGG
jgi:hypothetical protein